MRRVTVLVLLPGGRADYADEKKMPFLAGLARENVSGSVASTQGFAQTAAFVTGRHPDTTGHFGTHAFDPQASPFRWLRPFARGAAPVRTRRALLPVRRIVTGVTRWTSGAHRADPGWIPLRALPYLRPLEGMHTMDAPRRFGAPGLFDVCQQRGIRYQVLDDPRPGSDETVAGLLTRALRSDAPYDVYVVRLRALQEAGEAYGPFSEAVQAGALRATDARLASVHAALTTLYDAWDLLVCGEQGMAPVSRAVDLHAAIAARGLRPGREFVAVVQPTLAAFWCLGSRGDTVLQDVLPSVPGSYLVTEAERRHLRIPAGRRAGDFLLAARPGVVFWRDHFHPAGPPARGAAGYVEKAMEGDGVVVLASRRAEEGPVDVGRRHLVDLLPTLCGLLAAPAPDGVEGVNILEEARAIARMHAGAPEPHLVARVVADV